MLSGGSGRGSWKEMIPQGLIDQNKRENSWALSRGLRCTEHAEVSLTASPGSWAGVCCRETGILWRWLQFNGYQSTAEKGNLIITFFIQVSYRWSPSPKSCSYQYGHEQRWSFVSLYFYTALLPILIIKAVFGQAAVTCSQSPLTSSKLLYIFIAIIK